MNGNTKMNNGIEMLMKPEEVAAVLQLHVKTVQKKLLTGEIESIQVCKGKRSARRVRPSALARYMTSMEDRRR